MRASVLIPAYNEADRIAETVRAARGLSGVSEVIVINDGSNDGTAEAARAAGADRVIEMPCNSGKGAALNTGIEATDAEVFLLLDADLGPSASAAAALLEPVLADRADMTIAVLPSPAPSTSSGAGGFGFAVGLARWGIRKFTGRIIKAPLSGQRALKREIIDRMNGLDRGFGVEVGLTIDALRMGYRVEEVPVELSHRATGRTFGGFVHRGRQFLDIARALIRRLGWRKENFKGDKIPSVLGLYIVAVGAIGAWLGPSTSSGWPTLPVPAARLYLVALLGFGILGLADDLFGSRNVGGFRGHFAKLLLERRVTTGAAKALGGGLISIYLGYRISGGQWALWALDAAAIALASNTLNLLDVRPGRALSVFFLGMTITVGLTLGRLPAPAPVIAVIAAAASVAWYDVRGKAMLGDVGSNTLGAVLGLTIALNSGTRPAGTAVLLMVVAIFLAINLYSERRSISELIERHPLLARIDSKLGVR